MISLSTDKPAAYLPALKGRTPADYLLCNCAKCQCELLGESERGFFRQLSPEERKRFPSPVAGRILGRPYCPTCLSPASRSGAIVDGWGIPKKRQPGPGTDPDSNSGTGNAQRAQDGD